jgi:hypothetical protein
MTLFAEESAMTPFAEESAQRILGIFKTREVRAGETLIFSDLARAFIKEHWQRADFLSGMEYAADHELIEIISSDLVKLTQTGFEVL